MARVPSLEDIYEEIREDDGWDYLRQPGIVLVKGKGQTDSPLAMLVGAAPGATENTHRVPFGGPSGRVLRQLMGSADLVTEDDACTGSCGSPHAQYDCPFRTDVRANAFVTLVCKYRLPGNRQPNARESILGAEILRKEWAALGRPRLIVAVGSVARDAVGPVERRIYPGDWMALPDGETFLWVQYHPNYGIQHPEARGTMEEHWEAMGQWIRESL